MTERILIIIGYLSASLIIGISLAWAMWAVCDAYDEWKFRRRLLKRADEVYAVKDITEKRNGRS